MPSGRQRHFIKTATAWQRRREKSIHFPNAVLMPVNQQNEFPHQFLCLLSLPFDPSHRPMEQFVSKCGGGMFDDPERN
jgi:hypothetical protein